MQLDTTDLEFITSKTDALTRCLWWAALAAVATGEQAALDSEELEEMISMLIADRRPVAKA